MLDLVYNLPIQKQDRKIIVGKKLYSRGGFAAGIGFEQGILVLAGVLYYPPDSHSLFHDSDHYPVKEITEALKSKHGDEWEDFYIPPQDNCYDVMGEFQFSSLTELRSELERLTNTFEARLVCQNTEADFAYQVGGVSPVLGDRAYLLTMANQIQQEDRCETSNAAKRVLSKDQGALLALGCAFAALEKMTFYELGGSSEGGLDFILSYT